MCLFCPRTMRFIDVIDVGYGECIVFEGNANKIFMVDCGSMNTILKSSGTKFKDYVTNFIMPRYRDACEKNFLLTHFHKDHFCGLKYILKKEKNYFDKIYIPYPALAENRRALILEMAIYAFVFLKRQQTFASLSTSALFIFEFLRENSYSSKIFPLKRGDIFNFSGVNYQILNPFNYFFPFSPDFINIIELLDTLLRNSLQTELVGKFFYLRNSFCEEYINCCDLCRKFNSFMEESVNKSIKKLKFYAVELNNLSKNWIGADVTSEIISILNTETTRMLYSYAQNSASIVFQNAGQTLKSCENILMTGDVTSEILNLLENDLFCGYNVIKVPHHGTNNYKSGILNRLTCSHMIISSGNYRAGGKISGDYAKLSSVKHCSNEDNCEYFLKNNSCCNRVIFCSSLKKYGELSSRCAEKNFSSGVNRCGIYVISSRGIIGCYCD